MAITFYNGVNGTAVVFRTGAERRWAVRFRGQTLPMAGNLDDYDRAHIAARFYAGRPVEGTCSPYAVPMGQRDVIVYTNH